jgi:phosphate transport system substrate-binding protein
MDYIFGDPAARAPAARLVTGSNNEEQTKIAQSDAAIGMLSSAWMNADVIGLVIEDQGITYDPAKTSEYPNVRRLNLVTRGEPQGLVKEFIQFIQGQAGHKFVQQSGYSIIDSTKRNGYAASH